jgi:hypothetical protein
VRDQSREYRFVIRWPVERDDLPGLGARLVAELHGRPPGVLICDLGAAYPSGAVDAVAVDALARLAVAARRCRWTVLFEDVPAELAALIAMMGLTSVLIPGEPAGPGVHRF